MGSKFSDDVLMRKEEDMEKRKADGHWSDVATCQGTPGVAGSYQKIEAVNEGSSPEIPQRLPVSRIVRE